MLTSLLLGPIYFTYPALGPDGPHDTSDFGMQGSSEQGRRPSQVGAGATVLSLLQACSSTTLLQCGCARVTSP